MKTVLFLLAALLIFVVAGTVRGQDLGGTIYGESVLGITFLYFQGPTGPATPVVVTLTGVYALEVDSTNFPNYFVHLFPMFHVYAPCETTSIISSPLQTSCTRAVHIARANSDMPFGSQEFITTTEGRNYRLWRDGGLDAYELKELGHPNGGGPTSLAEKIVGGLRRTPGEAGHLLTPSVPQQLGSEKYYLFSGFSVWASNDTGATWQIDSTGLGGTFVWDIAVDTMEYVYAATNTGLFRQSYDSTGWEKVSTFTLNTNVTEVFVDHKNRIFLVGNGGGVYLSTDAGSTWSVDTTGLGTLAPRSLSEDAYGNIYAVFTNSVYKSEGGTGPWTDITGGITALAGSAPVINSVAGNNFLFAGTSVGLLASSDQGTSWQAADSGLQAETFYGIAKNRAGKILVSAPLGIYSRDAGDTTWVKAYPPSGMRSGLPVQIDNAENFYTIEPDPTRASIGTVLKSTDAGSTWSPDSNGISSTQFGIFSIDELGVQHIASSQFSFTITDAIYKKPVGGSWELDTTAFPVRNQSFATSIVSNKHGWLYLSGSFTYPATVKKPRVLRRPIGGGPWTADSAGIPAAINNFSGLVADTTGLVYGRTSTSIYARTAGGWTNVPFPAGLSGATVISFACDFNNALWAAFQTSSFPFVSGQGVYTTTDQGVTWILAGLDNELVKSIACFGDTAYVITENGIAALTMGTPTTVKDNLLTLPQRAALYDAYPNPFNPSTRIRYAITNRSHVMLKVYNVLGQLIATLRDGMETSGEKEVTWDAWGFASGIYFYRIYATDIETGKTMIDAVKKMVLVK